MRTMPDRLADWGYKVSTGPLVWNRFKGQLKQRPAANTVPLIWAEAVSAAGTFGFRAARRNHAPYFTVTDADAWLLVKQPCVLLQRTTSKEQPRRLIAAELEPAFLREHGAVTVENHLNMLVPSGEAQHVDTATLAAFLNSGAADRAFRCISGSVAVSAYELEAMPVPSAKAMQQLTKLLRGKHTRADIERVCDQLYGDA
jgi:adenine-specific DNA-methyltransferase